MDNKAMSRKGVNSDLGHNSLGKLAFGFWQFPIECLDPDLGIDRDPSHPEQNRILDLSGFNPELCLFQIY
jgi:hypothetical protein